MHLDDPRFAVRAEVNRDRVDDQRLGGDQLDPQTGADANRTQRRLRCFGLRSLRAFFRPERCGQLAMNFADDFVLEAGGQFRRSIVVDHRARALVAALAEDALRRDVARRIVGIGVDPKPIAVKFPLEPQRVIDDDLARQKQYRQLVTEAPTLDGIIEPGLQHLVSSQAGELHPGVVADCVRSLGQALPLSLGRRRAEREGHLAKCGVQPAGDRVQRALQPAGDLVGDLPALRRGGGRVVAGDAGVGILIRTAAYGNQRHRAGVIFLQPLLRVAGPVAADLVVRERHTMTGVTCVNRADATVGRAGDEHRQIVIDRATLGAAVLGKANLPRAAGTPLEPARLQVAHRLECGLLDPAGQLFRVTVNALLVRRRDRLAEQGRCHAGQHRRGVGVRGGDGEAFRGKAGFRAQPLGHGLHHRPWHSEVVDGDEHRGAVLAVVDRQRLGPDFLGDPLRLGPPKAEAAQPHRETRRDIDRRRTDAPPGVGLGGYERDEQQSSNERKRFHAAAAVWPGGHRAQAAAWSSAANFGESRFWD